MAFQECDGVLEKQKKRQPDKNNKPLSNRKVTKQTAKEYRSNKGPKRFKVIDAANSAARSHYRAETTNSFKTWKTETAKKDLKEARLTNDQIKNGRYRVSRARSIKRNIGSVAFAAALATPLVASGGAALGLGLAAVGGTSMHFVSGAHYYGKQRKAYGSTRA